jgi:hypothetical protein
MRETDLLNLANEEGAEGWKLYANTIVASTWGNAFPTNLDRDIPSGSTPPPAMVDVVMECLKEHRGVNEAQKLLEQYRWRRHTHADDEAVL